MEVVALRLTAEESEVLHNLVCKAINDFEMGNIISFEGRDVSKEKAILENLKERLYLFFYQQQEN